MIILEDTNMKIISFMFHREKKGIYYKKDKIVQFIDINPYWWISGPWARPIYGKLTHANFMVPIQFCSKSGLDEFNF